MYSTFLVFFFTINVILLLLGTAFREETPCSSTGSSLKALFQVSNENIPLIRDSDMNFGSGIRADFNTSGITERICAGDASGQIASEFQSYVFSRNRALTRSRLSGDNV